MEKKLKYFLFIFLGGVIFANILFLSVSLFIYFFHGSSISINNNGHDIGVFSQISKKEIKIYSISGKIKDIKKQKIYLETLSVDYMINSSDEKKLEIRELSIGNNTKIIRLDFIPREKNVVMPKNPTATSFGSLSSFKAESTLAFLSDFNIGDNISADYSDNLADVKNFTPELITILPYSVF